MKYANTQPNTGYLRKLFSREESFHEDLETRIKEKNEE